MDQTELNRKAALNQMVLRQLERMGLLGAGLHTGSIKDGLTNSGDYADRQQALIFLDLMKMSDPNKSPEEMKDFVPASEAMKAKLAEDPLYAVNTQAAVLDGRLGDGKFTGPGHQKSEGEFSPRSGWDWFSGKKYEASEGDKYINRYNNDLRLAEALSKPNHDIEQGAHYLNPFASNRSIQHWVNGTNDTEHAQALDQHIQDQGLEDQVLGEGYRPLIGNSNSMNAARYGLEALEDPNSNLGSFFHALGERPYQLIRHGLTRHDEEDDRSTWQAAQDSFDAKGISNGGTQYLPDDYTDWRDQQAAYRGQKGLYEELEPHSYQDSYRSVHGKAPSYLGQKVVEFGEMLPDLSTLLSFGAGAGKYGLKAGAKAAAAELATQDTPMLGAVMGGTEMFNQGRPDFKDWLSQDRTDLPTEDFDQFNARLRDETRDRLEASKTLQGLLK
jgi:hypothetical protein